MSLLIDLQSYSYFLAWGINHIYDLPFSKEIATIGCLYTVQKLMGLVIPYISRKLAEKQMTQTQNGVLISSYITTFYILSLIHDQSEVIATFYESNGTGYLIIKTLAFLWRFQVNLSYYRKILNIMLSVMAVSGYSISLRLAQRYRGALSSAMERIETEIRNGMTVGFYYYGAELMFYPPRNRNAALPMTLEEIEEISPLRCAGLNNTKTDNEINQEYERPDNCVICCDIFNKNELHRTLPCLHTFHATCIDPWLLRSSGACPICKKHVKPILPQENTDENQNTNNNE